MNGRRTREAASEEADLQMTPMIDVTFLLLIFFLCSIKFKLLDGKLSSHLPREMGVNTFEPSGFLERIEISLDRSRTAPDGFSILLNGRGIVGLDRLHATLEKFHLDDPDLTVTLRAGEKIEHGHVVAVVNECLRAGFTRIAFSGTLLD